MQQSSSAHTPFSTHLIAAPVALSVAASVAASIAVAPIVHSGMFGMFGMRERDQPTVVRFADETVQQVSYGKL